MPEWDDFDLTDRERQLETQLTELGSMMREAAHARTEVPDPAFISALRARLVEPEPVVPDVTFERRLRNRLVGRRLRFAWPVGFAAGAVAAAALVVLLVLHPFTSNPQRRPLAVGVPQPSRQDLTRGFPPLGAGGGGGGPLSPVVSRVELPRSPAYPTRLHLMGTSFSPTPSTLPIYRLAAHPFNGVSPAGIAHRLGIGGNQVCMNTSAPQPVRCSRSAWTVVAQHLFPSSQPLHSLAVSPTGEIIYHDLAYDQASYRGTALPPRRAITIARAWLSRIGWPASDTSVLTTGPAEGAGPLNAGLPIAVSLSWNGTIRGTVPAATIWVAPTGRVVEAHLWPPVVRRLSGAARDIGDAWTEVENGTAPVAMQGGPVFPTPSGKFPSGTGSATKVEVVQVLVTPVRGPSYLEPAYRFSGKVTLGNGEGTHSWYALVAAVARR